MFIFCSLAVHAVYLDTDVLSAAPFFSGPHSEQSWYILIFYTQCHFWHNLGSNLKPQDDKTAAPTTEPPQSFMYYDNKKQKRKQTLSIFPLWFSLEWTAQIECYNPTVPLLGSPHSIQIWFIFIRICHTRWLTANHTNVMNVQSEKQISVGISPLGTTSPQSTSQIYVCFQRAAILGARGSRLGVKGVVQGPRVG